MEYVSREEILAEYDRQHKGPAGGARKIMETWPAADVVPVRRGKWIVAGDNQPNSFDKFYACSSCRTGRVFKWHQTPYCPYCGAKME